MTTTWTEEKLASLITEREKCIACGHLTHDGMCGSTARLFAKGPCRCGEKLDDTADR